MLEFGFDFAEIFYHKVVSAVCSTPRRQGKKKRFLSKSTFFTSKSLFVHDRCVQFTLKRISPDCHFKSNQRQMKISILNPRRAIYLHVGWVAQYTLLRSSPWFVAHLGDHLCGMLHSAEIISSV